MSAAPSPPLRLVVAFATLGRPDMLSRIVGRLALQSRQAELVLVSAVSPSDTAGIESLPFAVETIYGSKGLCAQRNRALDHIGDRADVVLFLDDDFVLEDDYLSEMMRIFETRPDIVGATGNVIADGITSTGFTIDQATGFIAARTTASDAALTPRTTMYGCNMAFRLAALGDLRFDERLPLYGWLEDIDLTYRLSKRGTLVTGDAMIGVHLGVKGGRTSGTRLGYSQIANPVYMLRRGTIPRRIAVERIARNLLSNVMRSPRPEPHVDRRGRLRGNLRAIGDLLVGRVDPERILTMD